MPFYNSETVDMSNLGGPSRIELKPARRSGFAAEAGLLFHFVSLAFFYEIMRFGQSDLDDKYGLFFQPESDAAIYGIKLGAVF